MDYAFRNMDITIMVRWRIFKEERFRTPLNTERAMGLWVDRIGSGVDRGVPQRLRVLGQYAAVRVEAGTGRFYSRATGEIPVGPGQVMILFPDEPQTYYADTEWSTKWIVWNGPDARMLEKLGYLSRDRSIIPDVTEAVSAAHLRLIEIINDEGMTAVLERKAVVLAMVLALARGRPPSGHGGPDARRMEKVVAYLAEHFDEDVPIEDLAERFNISVSHFRRVFKAFTGRSPRQFVTSLRISKAKQLLSQGMTIKEVAALVGYEDLFYFMRMFKKTTGVSPGRFAASNLP